MKLKINTNKFMTWKEREDIELKRKKQRGEQADLNEFE